jgi:hypothetical protein
MADFIQYSSADKKYNIEFSSNILQQLIKHIELAENRETGGVLAGYYSQLLDRAIIKNLTGPPKDWILRTIVYL